VTAPDPRLVAARYNRGAELRRIFQKLQDIPGVAKVVQGRPDIRSENPDVIGLTYKLTIDPMSSRAKVMQALQRALPDSISKWPRKSEPDKPVEVSYTYWGPWTESSPMPEWGPQVLQRHAARVAARYLESRNQ